jgi:hypothetical protein
VLNIRKKVTDMRGILIYMSILVGAVLFAASQTQASELETVIAMAQPFLPPWAQVLTVIVTGLWGFVTQVRPQIPNQYWEKTGKTGQVIDKYLAGNRKHTENKPK